MTPCVFDARGKPCVAGIRPKDAACGWHGVNRLLGKRGLSVHGRGHVEGVILIVGPGKGWALRTRFICEITKTQMGKGVRGRLSQPVTQYPGAEHAANTLTSLL